MLWPGTPMRIIVAGWFSYANGHATAGDILSGNLIRDWLTEAGIPTDLATHPPFTGGVDWRAVDPAQYTHLVFVCGPFGRGELEAEILLRFSACRLIGMSLSMSLPLESWNPFDFLIERDSSAGANADLVFGTRAPLPRVVGVCLVEEHDEAEVPQANAAIAQFLDGREIARLPIDTRLDRNEVGLRTAGEVETLIARVDVLLTTRLHGLVLALKNGVPAIAVDAVPGGGKIVRQCGLVGWPNVLTLDRLGEESLSAALDYALSPEGRTRAHDCGRRARESVEDIRARLLEELGPGSDAEGTHRRRLQTDRIESFRADLRDLLPPIEELVPPQPQRRRKRLWERAASMFAKS